MPKGLAKKTTPAAKPAVSTKVSSSAVGTGKAVAAKKVEVKKQDVEEEEDWGDAWG